MSSAVMWVAWTAVNALESAPTASSSAVGVTPCALSVVSFSARLLGDVGVERPASLPASSAATIGGAVGVDRADAVDRGAEPRPPVGRELARRAPPTRRRSHHGTAADPAVQIAGVEQGDADPDIGRRGDDRAAERVRVRYGVPSRSWWT